jgi:hypothetical protein
LEGSSILSIESDIDKVGKVGVEEIGFVLTVGNRDLPLERGQDYEIAPAESNRTVTGSDFKINLKANKLAKTYRDRKGTLKVSVNCKNAQFPGTVAYESGEFLMVGPPKWHYVVAGIGIVIGFNLLLVLLATRVQWIRRVILNPVGAHVVGLVIGKYLLIDFLIQFVRPIKLAMFRQYRGELKQSPVVREWQKNEYIPPEIEVPGGDQEIHAGREPGWRRAFKTLLKQPQKRIWLIQGESGLGKSALLEKWTDVALYLNQTPILIRLDSDLPAEEEAKAQIGQYGEIDVNADTSRNMLKGGGFVILLDGFNEDRNRGATLEFVRQLIQRNLVVMTTQPGYESELEKKIDVQRLNLEPFGREQLLKVMDEHWVDALLEAGQLAEIASLPQMALLLGEFIKDHNQLPEFRLDIYENLRRRFVKRVEERLGQSSLVVNFDEAAWQQFKDMKPFFAANETVPKTICDAAVTEGILASAVEEQTQHYRFRHDLIRGFFVACYLDRRETDDLIKTLHQSVWQELNPAEDERDNYWRNVLDFWAEFYGRRACQDREKVAAYQSFLDQVGEFSPTIFARLYIYANRLHQSGRLKLDEQFVLRAADVLARNVS